MRAQKTLNTEDRSSLYPDGQPFAIVPSRLKGVFWHPSLNRWRSYVDFGGKWLCLGSYIKEEEAAQAYDIALYKLYGVNCRGNLEHIYYRKELEALRTITDTQAILAMRQLSGRFSSQRSFYRGVLPRDNGLYMAVITTPDPRFNLSLGVFMDEKDAALAYDKTMVLLKGRAAQPHLNFGLDFYHKEMSAHFSLSDWRQNQMDTCKMPLGFFYRWLGMLHPTNRDATQTWLCNQEPGQLFINTCANELGVVLCPLEAIPKDMQSSSVLEAEPCESLKTHSCPHSSSVASDPDDYRKHELFQEPRERVDDVLEAVPETTAMRLGADCKSFLHQLDANDFPGRIPLPFQSRKRWRHDSAETARVPCPLPHIMNQVSPTLEESYPTGPSKLGERPCGRADGACVYSKRPLEGESDVELMQDRGRGSSAMVFEARRWPVHSASSPGIGDLELKTSNVADCNIDVFVEPTQTVSVGHSQEFRLSDGTGSQEELQAQTGQTCHRTPKRLPSALCVPLQCASPRVFSGSSIRSPIQWCRAEGFPERPISDQMLPEKESRGFCTPVQCQAGQHTSSFVFSPIGMTGVEVLRMGSPHTRNTCFDAPRLSQYKGVFWDGSSGKWTAGFFADEDGKQSNLGQFDFEEQAKCAYDLAALKTQGSTADINSNLGDLAEQWGTTTQGLLQMLHNMKIQDIGGYVKQTWDIQWDLTFMPDEKHFSTCNVSVDVRRFLQGRLCSANSGQGLKQMPPLFSSPQRSDQPMTTFANMLALKHADSAQEHLLTALEGFLHESEQACAILNTGPTTHKASLSACTEAPDCDRSNIGLY